MLKSPYTYFGGKGKVAAEIWRRLGDVPNYVEPFLGSGAVLLQRPAKHLDQPRIETVNDKDGMISNFWRAVQAVPDEVARWADWPVNENDLHARHGWLVRQKFETDFGARLEGDPDYYDAKIAGWWVWGMACWIGSGFCSGEGRWQQRDGVLVKSEEGGSGRGIKRQLPHLGDGGQGITRRLPNMCSGNGIQSQQIKSDLHGYMGALQARLKRVRVVCGDWTRVMGDAVLTVRVPAGIVLDPPYTMDNREAVYNHDNGDQLAVQVREWAIQNGNRPKLRIAYCGYEDGFKWPSDWVVYAWKAHGGYSNNGSNQKNRERERIWFSPACLKAIKQRTIFDYAEVAE